MSPTATGPGASLSLLQRIVDDSMDPSYAEVAARREAEPSSAASVRRPGLAVGAVLAALGVLAAAAVAQTWRELPEAQRSRSDLVERVQAAAAANDVKAAQVESLAADVDALRTSALTGAGVDARLEARLSALSLAAGADALVGPGVRVVLDDGPPSRVDGVGPDLARVLDRDLQLAVNGLFAAGAEAVEVNGQRITTLTAIRSAGDAVLVGFRPLARPYVVEAIGDPRTLEARFVDSAPARALRTLQATYGMRFETTTVESIELSGEPPTALRFAEPGER